MQHVRLGVVLLALGGVTFAQQRPTPAIPRQPLGPGPFTFDTAEQHKIRVIILTKGLSHPWGLAFLPDGNMLVTEREGRLRLIREGVLDPNPIGGVPQVYAKQLSGLMDVALHSKFSENRLVYLTYTKPAGDKVTTALARGRYEGGSLTDVRDIFVADSIDDGRAAASRIVFARDGSLYMTVGGTFDDRAQNPASHGGKVLRLRDDGTAPPDNPFVGRAGYSPKSFPWDIAMPWVDDPSRDGDGVGKRKRAEWRRRGQSDFARQELRMAHGQLWPPVSRTARFRARLEGRNGGAGSGLASLDRNLGDGILQRRQVSGMEAQPICGLDAAG
jgi:hypothetical protein